MIIKRIHVYFVLAVWISLAMVCPLGCTRLKPKFDAGEDSSLASDVDAYRTGSGLMPSGGYATSATGGIQISNPAMSKYNETHFDSDGGAAGDAHCNQEGALRCVTIVSAEREVCLGGTWVASDPCGDSEICNRSDLDDPGSCIDKSLLCLDSAGRFICNGDTMFECEEDGVAVHQERCLSRQHCVAGLSSGMCARCIPEQEHLCDDRDLMVCAEDGMAFELHEECPSADACNDEVGVCESVDECYVDSDCGEMQECRKTICEKGQCTTTVDEGGTCGYENESVCNASGECVACVEDDDCREPTPHCNGETNKCAECVESAHCDEAEECIDERCKYEPRCGNGKLDPGEQCDDGDKDDNDGCPNSCRFKFCTPDSMCLYWHDYYGINDYCNCNDREACMSNLDSVDPKWACMYKCNRWEDCQDRFGNNKTGEPWKADCQFGVCVAPCNYDSECPEDTFCSHGTVSAGQYAGQEYHNCSI